MPIAVEEMVRWTSPSPSKRRTANRDAVLFEHAGEFDVNRKPNPHLGFSQDVHYCLGANLARLELCVLFDELLMSNGLSATVIPE